MTGELPNKSLQFQEALCVRSMFVKQSSCSVNRLIYGESRFCRMLEMLYVMCDEIKLSVLARGQGLDLIHSAPDMALTQEGKQQALHNIFFPFICRKKKKSLFYHLWVCVCFCALTWFTRLNVFLVALRM